MKTTNTESTYESGQGNQLMVNKDVKETISFLDLELPSGTLWATCNLGAQNPLEPGDFFAWGERSSKKYFSWDNYQFRHKTKILPEEDVATILLGKLWKLPSAKQVKELIDSCIWRTSPFYRKSYVKGISKYNNAAIYLPVTGYMEQDKLMTNDRGAFTGYLSSSLGNYCFDYSFGITIYGRNKIVDTGYLYRNYGHFVRPVFSLTI